MGERRCVDGWNSTKSAILAVAALLTGCRGGSVTAKDTFGSGPISSPGEGGNTSAPHGWVPGYGTLPIRFEPNVGQAPAPMKYLARGVGYAVAITEKGAVVSFQQTASPQTSGEPATRDTATRKARAWLRVRLLHARPKPLLRAENQQTSVSNYFIGADPSKWRSNVANYSAIRYEQVYPGIDWVIYGNPHQLEYDFVVSPKADPRRIELKVEGARVMSVDGHGDLLVKMQDKTLRQLKPVIYQTAPDGVRQDVDGRYVLDHQHVAFALGDYDHSRQLVIDPTFVYSTYLGGSGGDAAAAIAVDGGGNAYVAGSTTSVDFPTLEPIQGTNQSRQWGNAFVTKFNSTGTALIYSTYLGGNGNGGFDGDGATAIAVDAAGNAYIAGFTSSTNFPTVNSFQAVNNAASNKGSNAFLVKLNAAGSALLYSTYLGGSGRPQQAYLTGDGATAIAVDGEGEAFIAGRATSMDFPTLMPFQATNKATGLDSSTAFVAKFNTAGSALLYSTYLGGSTPGNGTGDSANAIAVDGAGSAYVVGATSATDFPTVAAVQTVNRAVGVNNGGVGNAFVTKFDATGSALLYSTSLGGSVNDSGRAGAVDAQGNAYVTGYTQSSDFPTSNPWQAVNKAVGGGANAFVTKFNATGSALVYSTYLGASNDEANAIAVDVAGNAYIAGSTFSRNFPIADPLQSTNTGTSHGSSNAFISEFNPAGLTLKFSTYLGGSGSISAIQPDCNCAPIYDGDSAAGIALDGMVNLYVAGSTYSTDFPTVMAFQDTNKATNTGTSGTAFVTKIAMAPPPAPGWSSRGGGGAIGWGWLGALGLTVAVGYRRGRKTQGCRALR